MGTSDITFSRPRRLRRGSLHYYRRFIRARTGASFRLTSNCPDFSVQVHELAESVGSGVGLRVRGAHVAPDHARRNWPSPIRGCAQREAVPTLRELEVPQEAHAEQDFIAD